MGLGERGHGLRAHSQPKRSFAFSSSLLLVLGVVAFSSSLQLGLSLGHQPLSLVEIGELELAQRRGRVMLATSISGFARRAECHAACAKADSGCGHPSCWIHRGDGLSMIESQSGHTVLRNCRPIQKGMHSSYISLMRGPEKALSLQTFTFTDGCPGYGGSSVEDFYRFTVFPPIKKVSH